MESGKHVFIEKPMALRTAHAEALNAIAAKQGRELMVEHLLQYHPGSVRWLTDRLSSHVISLPMHPYLTDSQVDRVIEVVRDVNKA